MSKISDLNYFQHITLADNFKQKSEVLNTWRVTNAKLTRK